MLPGIMPVTALRSVPRMAEMGAAVPPWAVDRLEAADAERGAEGVRRAGIALATELCRKLLDAGAPGLHFYTLNRSSATRRDLRRARPARGVGRAHAAQASDA